METRLISDPTKAKIAHFCKHHLEQIARKNLVPLHHYTNGTSLIAILSSGTLWATQVSCLNDAKEIAYAAELLATEVKLELEKNIPDDEKIILRILDDALRHVNPHSAGAFVACFSAKKDDLSQWRAYGKGESAFSIEFDPQAIVNATKICNALLVPCEYDLENQKIFVTDVVKWANKLFVEGYRQQAEEVRDDWAVEFGNYFLWNLSFLAPLLKHPAFKDEEEWRLVAWLRPEDVKRLRFVDRQSMISRHLPLCFSNENENGYQPLPIKSVLVGPGRHKEISKIGVGDLMLSMGYHPDVQITDIPFRTV